MGKKEIPLAYVTSHNTPLVSASVSTQPSLCLLWRCHPDRPFLFWTQPCLRLLLAPLLLLFTFSSLFPFSFLLSHPSQRFIEFIFVLILRDWNHYGDLEKCTPRPFLCVSTSASVPFQPSLRCSEACAVRVVAWYATAAGAGMPLPTVIL